MKKREFIKVMAKGSLAVAGSNIIFSSCSTKEKSDDQARNQSAATSKKIWAWVTHKEGLSADEWKAELARAKKSGVDAVLFELYNGRYTYYEGGQLEMKEDILGKVLPICKDLGIEIHARMWTMPCNNERIIKEHPDWYVVNGLGEPAWEKPAYVDYYKFLCPCNPEVHEFVVENVRSLAKIEGLDGVHLDYVRLPDVILAEALQPKYNIVQDREYPQYDYSYSTLCREQFKAQTGIDPLTDLEDPSANMEWRQFRYDSVTNMVNNKLVPEAKSKGKMITAAVFPNWEMVRQEWRNWHLDAYLPMLYHNFYNAGIDWVKEMTANEVADLKIKKPIYSGLFIRSLTPEELKLAYEAALEGGGEGIAMFNLFSLSEEHWEVVAGLKK